MIADAGLAVRERYVGGYFGKSPEESEQAQLPMNVAYVLGRDP